MPNWCFNELEVTGKPKMISKLLKQIETTEHEVLNPDEATLFDFNKVIPMPDYEKDNWYSWRTTNWGTKWNANDVCMYGDWENGGITIQFETAWSPPEPVFAKLAEQNPSLTLVLKTYEEGMSFYATIKYKGKRVKVIEQGNFNDETPCDVYFNYTGDSYHHWCRECDERFECDGDVSHVCPECEAKVTNTENNLWEGEKESA